MKNTFLTLFTFLLLAVIGCADTIVNPTFTGTVTFNNSMFGGSAKLPPTLLGNGVPSSLLYLRGDGTWAPVTPVSNSGTFINSVGATNATQTIRIGTGWNSNPIDEYIATTGANTTIVVGINGTKVGKFSISGLNEINIGAVTPGSGAFTSLIAASGTLTGLTYSGGTMTGAVVTGLAAPTASSDAATKGYVDSLSGGIIPKTAVRVASTGNIANLTTVTVIDGVTLADGDRALLKNQSTTSQNGIYSYTLATTTLARASDANTAPKLLINQYYFVSAGTVNAGTGWFISTAPVVLGVDPIVFSQFSSSSNYTAGTGLTLIGLQFALDTTVAMQRAQNLADVSNVATARTNLGLGSLALQNSNAVTITGGTIKSLTTFGDTSFPIANSNFTNITTSGAGTVSLGATTTFSVNSGAALLNSTGNTLSGLYFNNSGGTFGGFSYNMTMSGANATLGFNGSVSNLLTINFSTGLTTFTTLAASSNANLRTTKGNLNLTVNVKDYGATGNGATDDTASINSAIAALISHGTLFFPPGKYRLASSPSGFTGLSYITITGQGAEIYNDTGAAGGNTFVVDTTCSFFEIGNLRFTGSSSVRGNGIHIRMGASYSTIHDCYFSGCSDFGVLVSYGNGGYVQNVNVYNCTSRATLGDGFHFGSAEDCTIANCSAISTGDDGLGIVADYTTFPPLRIEVVGFNAYQPGNFGGGGTHGCGIRIVDGASDIHITGGQIYQSCEGGVYIGRSVASNGIYNARIEINGLKVSYPTQVVGMLGGITVAWGTDIAIKGCRVETPGSGSGIAGLDINEFVVEGNTILFPPFRGIAADDGTTANVAASWNAWMITNNTMIGTPSNESYYITPAIGKVIQNVIISGNIEEGPGFGSNYIFTNRLGTAAKIINNTSAIGRTIANGGSGLAPTLANNN